MYTGNLTLEEMYKNIYCSDHIAKLFKMGLEIDNYVLAVSAVEELIVRGDLDLIVETLNWAFDERKCSIGENTALTRVARTLLNKKRELCELDPLLFRYLELLVYGGFTGPLEWITTALPATIEHCKALFGLIKI